LWKRFFGEVGFERYNLTENKKQKIIKIYTKTKLGKQQQKQKPSSALSSPRISHSLVNFELFWPK
jgi:hypothetical protein